MSKRAIIYARVSGDDVREGKEGRNLAEQVRMGREYAEGKGYSIVAELPEDDRGASGASMDLPQLNRVFSMAQAGEYDVLIVRELDRLSRRLAKQLYIEEQLKKAGVSIEYVLAEYADNPEGNLSKQIKAVISEYERLKINERMTRGRKIKVQSGSIITQGRKLYGYEVVTNNGKTTLAINPKEAEIVRLIFRWYADGMSAHRIVKELSRLEIPTPADRYNKPFYRKLMGKGQWGHSSLYSILNNESYIGSWYYSKSSPRSPNSKRLIKNPREKWIKAEVPAIIDSETWEATRRVIASNKQFSGGNLAHDYLMRGHLVCPECNGNMHATSNKRGKKTYLYYICMTKRIGKRHPETYYKIEWVDGLAWAWVKKLLLDPEAISRGLTAYKQEQEASAEPITRQVSIIENELSENRESLRRLLDLYLSGEFHKDVLITKKSKLEKTIAELEKERTALLGSLEKQTLTNEQEKSLLDFTQEIGKGMEKADESFQTRRKIIDMLGVKASLENQDGQKTMRIKCILGENFYVLSPMLRV